MAGPLSSRPLGGANLEAEGAFMGNPHWEFFLAIEDDLDRTFRYVEPVEQNFSTFSVEYVKILLTASAEVDVVCTLLCREINPEYGGSGIGSHRKTILGKYPRFDSIEILLPRCDMTLAPWMGWRDGKNPDWWRAYNAVKHKRYEHFPDANVRNAIMSTSALFGVLAYLHHTCLEELVPTSRVFTIRPHPKMPFSTTRYALPDFEW
jgi:hypothetical protein